MSGLVLILGLMFAYSIRVIIYLKTRNRSLQQSNTLLVRLNEQLEQELSTLRRKTETDKFVIPFQVEPIRKSFNTATTTKLPVLTERNVADQFAGSGFDRVGNIR